MSQVFRVERTKNFTVMSNHHFKNKKLSFGDYVRNRVTIIHDICAAVKGYEMLAVRKIQKNGGRLI